MTVYIDIEHNAYGDLLSIQDKKIIHICTDEEWLDYCENPDKYLWDNNKLLLNPEYESICNEKLKQEKITQIKSELDKLDLKSIRAIRANDQEYLVKYEARAEELRKQLKELSGE